MYWSTMLPIWKAVRPHVVLILQLAEYSSNILHVYPWAGATLACALCVGVMGVMVSMHTKLVTLIHLRDLLIKADLLVPFL